MNPGVWDVVDAYSGRRAARVTYIGIDPGLSGAVAAIWPDGVVQVWDTPVVTVRKSRRDYLTADMATILRNVQGNSESVMAMVERGIPMPRQSSSTTYTTGRGGGLWEGILAGLGIGYELVAPRDWKKKIGLPVGADKGASRLLAQRLFPQSAKLFSRVRDDGRAEALLMAEYLRRQYGTRGG